MSFGVGDFIAVAKLAWGVYTAYSACKDAPEDFRNISDEIKSLHILIDMHKDIFQDKTLSSDQETRLQGILEGCTNVLEDLDKLRIKYMSLGSTQGSSSHAIDRIKWSQENIAGLRGRLTSNTTLLNTFITSCAHAEMLEMKGLFLRRKNSSSGLSLRSVASFAPSVHTKEAMKELCRQIYRAGVPAKIIQDRKDKAVAVFQNPNTSLVVDQDFPQTAGSVVHDEALSEEQHKGKRRSATLRSDSTSFRASALHAAAAKGFKQEVQVLLANGTNIEATRMTMDQHRLIPLHILDI
ncbi:hypothetical protein EV426DRAFT_197025 [Tirmania nivea]|nr:hypothetical protein EV426DRAFT_197025 [Tirmania nivea]